MSSDVAGDFLVDLAERLTLGCDSASIRAMAESACGGQLDAFGPDGCQASSLTASGVPFEVSVSGGRGAFAPALRYTAEAATQETEFDARVAAAYAAIRDLAVWMPNGDAAVSSLHSFLTALYPDPTEIPPRHRAAAFLGVVQHGAAPHHAARLKVYGAFKVRGALSRLCDAFPGFAELASVPDYEKLITPVGAALEVDAHGEVNHKVYLRNPSNDIAVPMKLARYFGDPAWEMLSEFVRGGIDPATLHRYRIFVCCARGAGDPGYGLHLYAGPDDDLTALVRELASRHHGTTHAVDALVAAAQSCGARWRYSVVGLGFSAEYGIDKLNVYGTPIWGQS